MSRKSKKQPYRNALLKLKKERSSLDVLYKENQRLNASLLYKHQEAQTLLKQAAKDRESTERLQGEALKEIRSVNRYHPALFDSSEISLTVPSDVLRYRISPPHVDWDDAEKMGIVKIACGKVNGENAQIAYGFSEAMIKNQLMDVDGYIIDGLSKQIAGEMIAHAVKHMRKW